jgi:hypothetical protein
VIDRINNKQAKALWRLHAAWICAVGFFITVITFYPGFMSPDSLAQYQQSLTFEFSDWHPPTFAFVWAIFNSIYPSPQWMLFIQVGGYWLILYLLMTSNDSIIYGLLLPTLLFISPMMVGLIGVIWKDVHLAVAWGLAFTIVYYFVVRSTPIPWFALIASLALFIYGSLIRHNAFVATAPFLIYLLVGRPYLRTIPRTMFAYVAIAIVTFASLSLSTEFLYHAKRTNVFLTLPVFDWAGITVHSGANQFPIQFNAGELEKINDCYATLKADPFIWGDCKFVYESLANRTSRSDAYKSWIGAIARHPVAYFIHRLKSFGTNLCVYRCPWIPEYVSTGTYPNEFGLETKRHALYDMLIGYVAAFENTGLYHPVSWLVGSVVVTGIAFRIGHPIAQTMGIASILYLLSLLPFGVSPSYRYAYPSVVLTVISFIMLLQSLSLRAPQKSAEEAAH